MSRIITISREFGSGGRELGKRLAKALGIPCYDHEIIEMIAKENGFNEDYVANVGEKSIEAAYPLTIGHRFGMQPFQIMEQPIRVAVAQRQIIENFAKQGDCVIVGRCADYVLRDNPNMVTVFITADLADRIINVCKRRNCSAEEARKLIEDKESTRSSYYNYYSGKTWGASASYDLCVNASRLGAEGTKEFVADFIRRRMKR